MANALPWKEVLDGIGETLTQVEAAALLREREMEGPGLPAPLAPDSSWQATLHAWDMLVAKLPAAASEAERECRDTEAVLGNQEVALNAWLQAMQASRHNLAAWDARYVAGPAHTI